MRVIGKRTAGSGDRRGLDALALRFGGGAPKRCVPLQIRERSESGPRAIDHRTRAATHEDVLRIVSLLEAEDVEDALVGGLRGLLRMKQNGRLKDRADAEQFRKILDPT